MRQAIVWARLLGLSGAVIRAVEWDEAERAVVARVRVRAGQRHRCPMCGRRSGRYDAGDGTRRWRAVDLGTVRAFLEADAPRVNCGEHGVVVARVPWARHEARFTRDFEDQAAWLAVHVSKTTLAELARIAWRTVGSIIGRVADERAAASDRLRGLTRIGIDEVSFRKGQRYLTVVINHDSGRVVWVQEGRDEATLERFFDALGAGGCKAIRLISADGASWIENVVRRRCPRAILCLDPFHVVSWATDALDVVRRAVWNSARQAGHTGVARELKGARYALWKNPDNLTRRQNATLSHIARVNRPLYRAYLLKEHLRLVFALSYRQGKELLDDWLQWARRCRLAPFVDLARTVAKRRRAILRSLRHRLSNARTESINTRIRLLTRIAFGFHSATPLVAMVMLALGGLCPPLPGRA